jgi:outer membrane protein
VPLYRGKDLEAKYKANLKKGKQLEAEINRFKQEAVTFKHKHKQTGQAWAQQKAELQKREQQLGYAQQALSQELQVERKRNGFISFRSQKIHQSSEKGYAYIYGTGDAASIYMR